MQVVRTAVVLMVLAAAGYGLVRHPPLTTLEPGEVGVRTNVLSGEAVVFGAGPVWVTPGLHDLRRYSTRDRVIRDAESLHAGGSAPFQSSDGMQVGGDVTVRYALDRDALLTMASRLPDDVDRMVVAPMVRGIAYRVFSKYTVKDIFTGQRSAIQAEIESALKERMKPMGILLRGVDIGRVELPAQYQAGLERLLQQALDTEQMKYTLQLKEKQVKEAELDAQADYVRRERNAEAQAREQVLAAKAQADAMVQVILYKHRQIEQKKLEAEADKLVRVSQAETNAEARRLESSGDADARRKLAEVEVYRAAQLARVESERVEAEGQSLSKHPLLVQKAMADKLSDKIQVIVMPPGKNGEIIDTALFGKVR